MSEALAKQLLAETLAGGNAIDGDTIAPADGPHQRVAGVDTPETAKPWKGQQGQPNAELARELLAQTLAQGAEREVTGTDRYGRDVTKVTRADGEDYATFAVRNGMGTATRWSGQEQHDAEGAFFAARQGIMPEASTPEERAIAARRDNAPWEFNLATMPGEGRSSRGTFGRAMARGADNLQATVFAAGNAVGELVGVEGVGEDGLRRNLMEAAANPAEIGEFDNVEGLADFGTYMAEALGEQVPNLIGMAIGAGAVATLARAAVGKAFLDRFAAKYGVEAAKKLIARRAALGGVAATSYPMGVGEIQMELKEAGIQAPGTAAAMAVPFAALDTIGLGVAVRRFFGPAVKDDVAKAAVENLWPEIAKRAGLGMVEGTGVEATTEAMQEAVILASRAFHDPEFDPFSEENIKRVREAGIKGGLVGGVIGGAGGAAQGVRNYNPSETSDAKTNGEVASPETSDAKTNDEVASPVEPASPAPADPIAAARAILTGVTAGQQNFGASNEVGTSFPRATPAGPEFSAPAAQPQEQQPAPPLAPGQADQQEAGEPSAAQPGAAEKPSAAQDLNGDTAPEPTGTIEAGLAAVAAGRKPAVYSKDEATARRAIQKVPGPWRVFPAKDGGVIVTRANMAEADIARAEEEGRRNELLGYVQPKESLDFERPVYAVRAVDAQGREVSAQLVNREYLEAAGQAAREQAGEGGTTDVTTVGDALALRQALRDDEQQGVQQGEDTAMAESAAPRRISLPNVHPTARRHILRLLPKQVKQDRGPKVKKPNGRSTQFVSLSAELPPAGTSDSDAQNALGVHNLQSDPNEVLHALGQVFVEGRQSEHGRISVRNDDMGAKNTPANLGAVAELGALVGEREFDGNESSVFRTQVNLRSGLAFLAERGYQVNGEIDPDTPVAKYTYKQVQDASSVSKAPARVLVSGLVAGDAQVVLRVSRALAAADRKAEAPREDGAPDPKIAVRAALSDAEVLYGHPPSAERAGQREAWVRAALVRDRSVVDELTAVYESLRGGADLTPDQASTARVALGDMDLSDRGLAEAVRTFGEALAPPNPRKRGQAVAGRRPQRRTAVTALAEDNPHPDTHELPDDLQQEAATRTNASLGEDTDNETVSDTVEMGEQAERHANERKRFESEDARQAGAPTAIGSTRDLSHTKEQVTHTSAIPKREAAFATALLRHLGIPTRVHLVGRKDARGGRIEYKGERVTIVLDPSTKKTPLLRGRILVHEIGHLVQRATLDQASAKTQEAMRKAFKRSVSERGGKQYPDNEHGFSEWFANELKRWVMHREKPRNLVGRFFKKLGAVLRKLFRKGKLDGYYKPDATFAAWLDSLAGVAANTRDGRNQRFSEEVADLKMPTFFPGDSAPAPQNYWGEQSIRRAIRSKRAAPVTRVGKNAWKITQDLHGVFTQSAGSYLRSIGQGWLADAFHLKADARGQGRTADFDARTRRIAGKYHERLRDLLTPFLAQSAKNKALGYRDGKLNRKDADYQAAEEALLEAQATGKPPQGLSQRAQALYDGIRKVYDDMHAEMTKLGLEVEKRAEYFPLVVDTASWAANEDAIMDTLRGKLGMAEGKARWFYNRTAERVGVILPFATDVKETAAGPGFSHDSERMWTKREVAALREHLITDIPTVTHAYIDAGARRGVINHLWGKTVVIKGEDGKERRRNDPMAGIHAKLATELAEGRLTPAQHQRITEKVLPALLGQLGAGMDPRIKQLSQAAVAYENIRLLGMVVLSSLVDPAGIVARGGFKNTWEAAKEVIRTSDRRALEEQARLLGAVRADLTEHITNDAATNELFKGGPQVWSEHFFRLVRAQAWTNFTRVFALSAGRHFLREQAGKAAKGDARATRYLSELGVTHEDVTAWMADQSPLAESEAHAKVQHALLQFVDEAVLRPNPSHRPVWASNPGLAVLWHLKSFMWSYYEVILKRLWSESAVRWGEAEGMQKLQAAAPAALLVATALPLGLLGYEARQMLGWLGGDKPEWQGKEGMDLAWEVTQRTGLLGPMQMFVDAGDAADRRRFALLAAAGPTVGHIEEWLVKPLDTAFLRSIPGVAQSPAAREWVRDNVFDK